MQDIEENQKKEILENHISSLSNSNKTLIPESFNLINSNTSLNANSIQTKKPISTFYTTSYTKSINISLKCRHQTKQSFSNSKSITKTKKIRVVEKTPMKVKSNYKESRGSRFHIMNYFSSINSRQFKVIFN